MVRLALEELPSDPNELAVGLKEIEEWKKQEKDNFLHHMKEVENKFISELEERFIMHERERNENVQSVHKMYQEIIVWL